MSPMTPEVAALFYALAFAAFVFAGFKATAWRIVSVMAVGLALWIFPTLWNAVEAL